MIGLSIPRLTRGFSYWYFGQLHYCWILLYPLFRYCHVIISRLKHSFIHAAIFLSLRIYLKRLILLFQHGQNMLSFLYTHIHRKTLVMKYRGHMTTIIMPTTAWALFLYCCQALINTFNHTGNQISKFENL